MPEVFSANNAAGGKVTDKESGSAATKAKTKKRQPTDYSQVLRQLKPSTSPLDAFAPQPKKVLFDSQLDNEKVLLLLRQHPITQIKWIFIISGLALLPFLLSFISFWQFVPWKYHFFSLAFWYLLVAGIALEAFLSWFYNVYIITDERVIDVDFLSLIYKNISAAKLDNIEDITSTSSGALATIFDIGTIKIQTAAEVTEFEFSHVPHPEKVTTLLNELLLEEEREKLEGRVN